MRPTPAHARERLLVTVRPAGRAPFVARLLFIAPPEEDSRRHDVERQHTKGQRARVQMPGSTAAVSVKASEVELYEAGCCRCGQLDMGTRCLQDPTGRHRAAVNEGGSP